MAGVTYSINAAEHAASYDVIVCGGGPGGCAAAIAAARKGLKTIIIEQSGCLGGVATNSLIGVWLGTYSRDLSSGKVLGGSAGPDSVPVIGGIYDEIVALMVKDGEAVPASDDVLSGTRHLGYASWHGRACAFEIEACKRALETLALEAGVELLYFTAVTGTQFDNHRVSGVFTHSKSGFQLIRGKTFIDATGDADIVAFTGAETIIGREEDGLMSVSSVIPIVEGVDSQKFEHYCKTTGDVRLRKPIDQLRKKGRLPFPIEIVVCCELPTRGRFFLNALRHIGVNGTDAKSMTRGIIEGRRQARLLIEMMRKIAPGFENARLVQTSPMIGIRDTRRIIAEYKIKVDDYVRGRRFPDTIALSGYAWDMSDPKKPDHHDMEDTPIPLPFVEVPYRALLPVGLDNVIVAGRSVSVEWQALGPIRIMPCCFAMGQAAGTAAVEAVRKDIAFKNIDSAALRNQLIQDKAILWIDNYPPQKDE